MNKNTGTFWSYRRIKKSDPELAKKYLQSATFYLFMASIVKILML